MARILIVGAGNGGFAAAADLVARGHAVTLYNRRPESLAAVQAQGGIRYSGVIGEGFAPVADVTADPAAARGAGLVLVCVPAVAHRGLARALAPHLADGQPVLLNPGGMLGSLAFLQDLRAAGCRAAVPLAETATLTYICRKPDPGSVRVTSVLREVPCAAFPARDTAAFLDAVAAWVPNLVAAPHVLATGFANVNAVLHPPAMILGAAWIERTGGDFLYYLDAATPAVARLLGALDRERLAVAGAWGVDLPTFPQLFASIGSTSAAAGASGDYLQVLLDSKPNHTIKAPPSLDHRYMHEDMPFGLAPLADLGRAAGVPVPTMAAVIQVASVITGRDYWAEARTLAGLGLADRSRDGLLQLLQEGEGWI